MSSASVSAPQVPVRTNSQTASANAVSAHTPHLARPDQVFWGFRRLQTIFDKVHFELQAHLYPSDRSKILYTISHLSGQPEAQATTEWSRQSENVWRESQITEAFFPHIFQQFSPGREAT